MRETGRQRSPSGARARRATDTQAVDTQAAELPVVPAIEPTVELLEDRTVDLGGGRRSFGLGRSLPGAVLGTLLVVGLAFGAALGPSGALDPASDRTGSSDDTAAAGNGGGSGGDGSSHGSYLHDGDGTKSDYEWYDGPDATEQPDANEGGDGDQPDPTKKPVVEPTTKPYPRPDPTTKPEPKPDPTKDPGGPIGLELRIKEYHPLMWWGSCEGLDFDYYKVVRSKDATVSWPMGEGDELVGAVERGGTRKAYDKYAPHGHKVWYRIFCVRKTEDGYRAVNATATKGILVPEEPAPPPTPDPITLELAASLTDGGKVVLEWNACDVDGFAFYKVVRSTSSDDPSYLPWHDGTEVIAAISEMGATQLETWAPDAGRTAWYRVQCLGYHGDQKVLLGESAVVAVTVE